MKGQLLLVAVTLICSAAIEAESATYTHAKIALHLTHLPAKNSVSYICQDESPNTLNIPCSSYVVEGALNTPYSLYVVLAQADPADTNEALGQGTRGVSLGIGYNGNASEGVDVAGWTSCADLEFPNDWPNSGSGNVLTWVDCQGTVISPDGMHAVIGAFSIYAYSVDSFFITPNTKTMIPALTAADCNGAQWDLYLGNVGRLEFGTLRYSCNPCVTDCIGDPVLPVTWGKIKSKYEH